MQSTHRASPFWLVMRRLSIGVCIVLAIVVYVLSQSESRRLEHVRMSLLDVTLPFFEGVTVPLKSAISVLSDIKDFRDVYARNHLLRQEIQQLRIWQEAAQQLEQENARLRALNNVKIAPALGYVTADVLADSASPFSETILVNVGRKDGIQEGAAVVDGAGLVGRVISLGESSARILLLTDLSSRISVAVKPSGQRGILAGNVSTTPLLDFLVSTENVSIGDRVVTTGDGRVLPPDLTVGRVKTVDEHSAKVVLASQYATLDFVRIIRYDPDLNVPVSSNLVGVCRECAMSYALPHP